MVEEMRIVIDEVIQVNVHKVISQRLLEIEWEASFSSPCTYRLLPITGK
jgi:hypothetical protein